MRNEADERKPQRRVVPFLTTPTQTARIFQTASKRSEPPVTTAVAKEPETSTFVLGLDTCGFITGSTIICDFGSQCINIDSYRGCCADGGTDCSATIYTDCLDYAEMPNAEMCGPHTLCCALSKAYCATYGFITEEQPGATFTHVQCAETPGFGELYAYPPEQGTTTEDSSIENTSSTLAVDPVDSTNASSSYSVSSGTIAGAAVGGIIFLLLAILGIFQIINRRRRQTEENTRSRGGTNSAPGSSTENASFGNRISARRLSSLSMIHEQQTHSPLSASPGDRRRSVSSILRQSFAPNWPLGPMSPRSPLSSHPVIDLEKRFSLCEPSPQPDSNRHTKISMPTLRIPTSPPPGSRLTPPPFSKSKSPLTLSEDSPTSARGWALQSPRLSYVPPPAIDVAFKEENERTLNGVGEPGPNALDKTETSSSVAPLLMAAASSPEVADTTVPTNNKTLNKHGLYINTGNAGRRGSSPDDREPVSPLSPLNQNNGTRGDQHLSFMSAPSISHDRSRGEAGGPVSPISLDDAEGRVSPITVSPLESRRGSFCAL
ncbi:hypothetical protein F4801DRAFT_450542 [Xylaria longipes]|nr:hypothetical protein F4801DRAFT_450542 [Xylaria longipes]